MKNWLFLIAKVTAFYLWSQVNNYYGRQLSDSNPSHLFAQQFKNSPDQKDFSLSAKAFTENKGQVWGYDGFSHQEVKYVFADGSIQVFLLENALVYQFTKIHYPDG